MKNPVITPTLICKCCNQELPSEAFYFNNQTQRHDYYCKECRKRSSRKQYKVEVKTQIVENQRKYPVITEIKDKKKRMELILHALQAVAESIERKKRRVWEEEDQKTDLLFDQTNNSF